MSSSVSEKESLYHMKKYRIIAAVCRNNVPVLKHLLDSPSWYRIRDEYEVPLLHMAIYHRSKETFDYLISLEDYPIDIQTSFGDTALLESFHKFEYEHDPADDYYALELIRKGANIHHVGCGGNTALHYAVSENAIRVTNLLLSKGVDVNIQNNKGDTALHICCQECQSPQLEEVKLLVCHGADPMIHNIRRVTPFDILLKRYTSRVITDQRDLFYYILDQYVEYDINVVALLNASKLDIHFFYRIIKNVREVIYDEDIPDYYTILLFVIKQKPLQILIEKFGHVVRKMLHESSMNLQFCFEITIQNFYILMESKLKLEFLDWLGTIQLTEIIMNIMSSGKSESSAQELICFLLSYGAEIYDTDLDLIYRRFGYCELFKMLLHMDVRITSSIRNPMPQLCCYVTVDTLHMQKVTVSRSLFKLSARNIEELMSFYAIPKLKEYCNGNEDSNGILEKIQKQPQVPLLVELARNVFRRYFIQTFGIRNTRQFYTLIKSLPISSYHKRIITLDVKLY